jgi:hypothetical protein
VPFLRAHGEHSRQAVSVATVDLQGDDVVVRLTPIEKLGALHGDVSVPRTAVRAVEVEPQPFSKLRGLRAPGTGWPGRIALGTWRKRGGKKDFVAVYRGRPAVILTLDDDVGYDRLVISVDSPDEVRRALNAA